MTKTSTQLNRKVKIKQWVEQNANCGKIIKVCSISKALGYTTHEVGILITHLEGIEKVVENGLILGYKLINEA